VIRRRHALLPLLAATSAAAQQAPRDSTRADSATATLAPVVVRALPASTTAAAAPWSLTVVARDPRDRARPGLALDEALRAVPGVQIDNRYNFALGERIAVRGFGARTQFGVRGVRVLVDGVPATLPDGQTTLNHVDVSLVRRVELLRGAASSVYGNAAGGVLLLETELPPAAPMAADVSALAGAHGLRRVRTSVGGSSGRSGWIVTGSRLSSTGYRAHADAESNWLLGRYLHGWSAGSASLVVSGVQYDARNPGSLSDSLLGVDRRQAFGNNVLQNTGESGRQLQVGGALRGVRRGIEGELTPYLVRREIDNPIPGRVVVLDRVGGGVRAVVRHPEQDGRRSWWAVGGELDRQRDDRQNYANESGAHGALLLDQLERVQSAGVFVQLGAAPLARLRVTGGARLDRVRFAAADRLVRAADPDDSGERTMSAFSPAVGASYLLDARLALHANVASSFETPTTTELANRPTGAGGFNPELAPQRARSREVGAKGRVGPMTYELSLFDAQVRDALIPFEVAGAPGRQFFRNAGRVRHRGLESAVRWSATPSLRLEGAYTRTDSRFVEFVVGGTDFAGNRVPGVAPHRAEVSGTWGAARGPYLGVDARLVSRTSADDGETAYSPGYAVLDLRAGIAELHMRHGYATVHAGVTNLLGARYNASVVANAFGRRYFEPAPERALFAGLTIRLASVVRAG